MSLLHSIYYLKLNNGGVMDTLSPIKDKSNEKNQYRLKSVAHGYELQRSTWNKKQQKMVVMPDGQVQWKFQRFYPSIDAALRGIWKEWLVNECETLDELRKEQDIFIERMRELV